MFNEILNGRERKQMTVIMDLQVLVYKNMDYIKHQSSLYLIHFNSRPTYVYA